MWQYCHKTLNTNRLTLWRWWFRSWRRRMPRRRRSGAWGGSGRPPRRGRRGAVVLFWFLTSLYLVAREDLNPRAKLEHLSDFLHTLFAREYLSWGAKSQDMNGSQYTKLGPKIILHVVWWSFCSCCCSPFLPRLATNILATMYNYYFLG